jgi:hypothetical protein
MQLESQIDALTDAKAVALLERFARGQPPQSVPQKLDQGLSEQLRAVVQAPPGEIALTSDGELARSALRVLADDPERREELQALLDHPAPGKFAVIETALLVSAVLIALQTHVSYERHSDGRWSVKIEKKPTSTALLKDLVKKLLTFQ